MPRLIEDPEVLAKLRATAREKNMPWDFMKHLMELAAGDEPITASVLAELAAKYDLSGVKR